MKQTPDGSKTHQSRQNMEKALEERASLNWNVRFCSSLPVSWVELAPKNGESTCESTSVDG